VCVPGRSFQPLGMSTGGGCVVEDVTGTLRQHATSTREVDDHVRRSKCGVVIARHVPGKRW
jgi:hypothetical protein